MTQVVLFNALGWPEVQDSESQRAGDTDFQDTIGHNRCEFASDVSAQQQRQWSGDDCRQRIVLHHENLRAELAGCKRDK